MSIAEEDIDFRVSMIEGSRLLAQAIADARKGWPMHPDFDRFIWGGKPSPTAGGDPNSGSTRRQLEVCERIRLAEIEADALRNPRTSCVRCGIRSDVGCGCPKAF